MSLPSEGDLVRVTKYIPNILAHEDEVYTIPPQYRDSRRRALVGMILPVATVGTSGSRSKELSDELYLAYKDRVIGIDDPHDTVDVCWSFLPEEVEIVFTK